MVRVLLVEDEEWIRKGLIKSILWDDLGLSLAGEAANGLEALSFFAHERIDIVITDMRMPACDGKELLIQMETRRLNCEVVVLSEYSDFDYMRQAIHAKVFDYLLKPVDTDVLNACLKRLVEKRALHQSREQNAKNPALAAMLAALDREERSSGAPDRLPEEYHAYFTEHPVYLACIQVLEPPAHGSLLPIERLADACMLEGEECELAPVSKPEGLTALLYTDKTNPRECGIAYIELLGRMQKAALQSGWTIRIGALRTRVSPELAQKTFLQASMAAQLLHRGENGLVFGEQVALTEPVLFTFPVNDKTLRETFSSLKQSEAEHLIQQFSRWVRSAEYLPVQAMQKALIDLSLSLEKSCQKAGFAVNISRELGQSYIESIHAVQTLPAMERYLDRLFTVGIQALGQKRAITSAQVVEEIVFQLQSRYAEDISLMEFSERYHLNYIYLSRLFKGQTGVTFTEYLQRVRMEHAKAFMEQGVLSTREIAELCGYPNPYYFISAYNKFFGKE